MHMLRVEQFPSAAIIVIAASLSFSCENRDSYVQADYNIQPEQKPHSQRKEDDAAFLAMVSNDVLLESQLAELAVRKASSPEVKEFAISVLTDHRIAMDELREISSKIDIPLPEEMSAEQRKHFVRIAKKRGLQFDRAFCEFIYLNNTVVLKKFERIAQDGSNKELRDWAWGKLGILKRHSAMAQNIQTGSSNSAEVGSMIN